MWVRVLALFFAWNLTLGAHDGLDLGPPTSIPDAWNVLSLCRTNIGLLVEGQQWTEIPIQASLSLQAARFLRQNVADTEVARAVAVKLQEFENSATFLIRASLQANAEKSTAHAATFYRLLQGIEADYDPKLVRAPVYSCPMCKGIRELEAQTPCFKCGMALVPRVIPASSLYNTPGEPSIKLQPTLDRPLSVGQSSAVKLVFTRKKDGAPLIPDDLLVVHTEKIHLLIIDESLTDYHHEHPRPTAVPGEYEFNFTPRKPGPYRVFADLVPRLSNVQEYPSCDLPATSAGASISDRATVDVTEVNGLRYELKWHTGGLPVQERQPVNASVTVTHVAGQPFDQLEPIMGAYAHLVGFYDDRQTVLHLHPLGAEPRLPSDRGGPSFNFRFYAPKAGFIRFYAQVQIGGQSVFAPFGLSVIEAVPNGPP